MSDQPLVPPYDLGASDPKLVNMILSDPYYDGADDGYPDLLIFFIVGTEMVVAQKKSSAK